MLVQEIVHPKETTRPVLIMPIGPSGAGKTTLYQKLKKQYPDLVHYSFDNFRHDWYDKDNYEKAWKLASADKTFFTRAQQVFNDLIQQRKNIYVDNMNLTPKSRKHFLHKAQQNNYTTIAYLFNVEIDTLLQRQQSRQDKTVPEDAVRRQAASIILPVLGEFDKVKNV